MVLVGADRRQAQGKGGQDQEGGVGGADDAPHMAYHENSCCSSAVSCRRQLFRQLLFCVCPAVVCGPPLLCEPLFALGRLAAARQASHGWDG